MRTTTLLIMVAVLLAGCGSKVTNSRNPVTGEVPTCKGPVLPLYGGHRGISDAVEYVDCKSKAEKAAFTREGG